MPLVYTNQMLIDACGDVDYAWTYGAQGTGVHLYGRAMEIAGNVFGGYQTMANLLENWQEIEYIRFNSMDGGIPLPNSPVQSLGAYL